MLAECKYVLVNDCVKGEEYEEEEEEEVEVKVKGRGTFKTLINL